MTDVGPSGSVAALREALGYVARHRGELFVIKIESGILDHAVFPALVRDIASLFQLGVRVVLVPGSRRQIDRTLATYGVESQMHEGVRVTPDAALPLVTLAAFDVCNRIMTRLSENGLDALVGNWVKARSMGVRAGIDFQLTGVVQSLRTDLLRELIQEEFVPIVPNIGWSGSGRPYNIGSTQLATELAVQMGASKLFYLCDEPLPPLPEDPLPEGSRIREDGSLESMNLAAAEVFLASCGEERLGQPWRDYLHGGLDACRRGVRRTHLVDGTRDGNLLREIFSQDGMGTMVYANEYENIRRAAPSDVAEMMRVMAPSVRDGYLVPRTAEDVSSRLDDYVVFEVDGFVQGCAALHRFPDGSAEVAAVGVAPEQRRFGIGRKLVQFLLMRARREGLRRVFLLTTQTSDWFAEFGFQRGALADLPPEKAARYDHTRASMVFVSNLRP